MSKTDPNTAHVPPTENEELEDLNLTSAEDAESEADEWDEEWDEEEWDDDSLSSFLEKYVQTIPDLDQYVGCIFYGPGIYFRVSEYGVSAMSSDPGCYVRGGDYPPFVTGPTLEERKCLKKMMKRLGFDDMFFNEVICDYDCDISEADGYFEEKSEKLEIYLKIKQEVASGKTPFKSLHDFISALTRYELDDNLWYMWEGPPVSLDETISQSYDSIEDFGIDKEGWMEILSSLDSCIVTPENDVCLHKGNGY
jgi:hypothetical protein